MAISTVHVPVLYAICGQCGSVHSFDGTDISEIDDRRVHPKGKSTGIACPTCSHPITEWTPENPLIPKVQPGPTPIIESIPAAPPEPAPAPE